jgi:transcriptional regulator with XRE-family HTH domain
MAATSSPTVWRRWLALELRRLRDEQGLAQKDAGKACGWSGARLSYIETGQQNVVDDDLDKLLPLYDVPDAERPTFYEAAAHAQEKGFWERNGQAMPEWMSDYVGLEQGAADIWHAEPAYVPGLLQTAAYATEVIRSDVIPRTDRQINRMVKMRMARKAVVTRPESPASVSVVMDESVLRRPAGTATAMAEQLDHLVTMAQRPNVTIRVLPFDRGVNACLFGAYKILGFPWTSVPGVVFIEYRDGATYLDDESAVDGHRLAFGHLADVSLSPDQSLAMMREYAEEYSSRA